ncbi:MAG: hypothetical protein WBC74_05965 [Candidatus Omnitrophota bacterium]
MRNERDIIEAAKKRNGRDFKRWINNTPTRVPDIEKIREITIKIDYSMSKSSEETHQE